MAYTAATTNATNTVTATATDQNATVAITNNGVSVENGTAATWADGTNNLIISVTNGDAQKEYSVTVTKT